MHSLYKFPSQISSRTQSQHSSPRHPPVISNEYISSPRVSLHVLGHNHLSFQEPPFSSNILLSKNDPLPEPTISSPVWSVCMKQSSGGFTHTKTPHSQPKHACLKVESHRFKGGCSLAPFLFWVFSPKYFFFQCDQESENLDYINWSFFS